MRIGMFTSGYQRSPMEHAFADAARFGYDYVELWGGRPHAFAPDLLAGDLTGILDLIQRYQVPVEVRPERSQALAIRWLISAARARSEHTMAARLSGELLDASANRGNAVKKREDTHRMAEANRAFSHYRW